MTKFFAFLYRLVKYRSVILGNITLGRGVFIRYCYIRGDISIGDHVSLFRVNIIGNVKIDMNTSIAGPYSYFHSVDQPIIIGRNCAIGPGTNIITSGHDRNTKSKSFSSGGKRTEAKIIIEDDVWVGAGSIILGGCHIKNNVTAAAGSIMLSSVYGPDKFFAGAPAREK